MDPPERVARELVLLLASGRSSATVGWPEKLFVRINALLPAVVDRAARRQLSIIERYARGGPTSSATNAVNEMNPGRPVI
jgi:hypothetical protein